MSDKLLPCPFCGERPVLLRDGSTAAPVYSDGEPIMPGDIVRHPDMHDSRMVTEVVLGLHGAFVRCMCGFETMRHDLFRRADADTPASLADEIDEWIGTEQDSYESLHGIAERLRKLGEADGNGI